MMSNVFKKESLQYGFLANLPHGTTSCLTITNHMKLSVFRQILILLVMAISFFCFASSLRAEAGPLGESDHFFYYELEGNGNSGRPPEAVARGELVVSAKFVVGPVVNADAPLQWFEIAFTRQNGQAYSAWVLLDGWPEAGHYPRVARYLWHEPDWTDYLEYVNEVTGRPVLPRLPLWQYGWPQTAEKSPARFQSPPERLYLHGWPFKLIKVGKEKATVPEPATCLELNPDLLIATTGVHRDMEGRHVDYIGGKHRYAVPMNEDDWRKDIAAGLNLFYRRSGVKVGSWIWRTNCYMIDAFVLPDGWPVQLYRSNYYGRTAYMDEPAIHIRGMFNTPDAVLSAGKLTPQEVVKKLQQQIRQTLSETEFPKNNYGNRVLGVWVDKVFGKGNLDILEKDIASWEAIWQTAWYQLAVDGIGSAGMLDEWILPEQLVERYNMTFGTQIPATVENACAIRVAIGRGAGRNFNKRWGTALYASTKNQLAEPKMNLTAMRYMYDAGATYFGHWFGWPGQSDCVVPYSYKRASASSIRQFFMENPNRDIDALMHAAKVCIAIPDGYTFTYGPMFGVRSLHLDRKNPEGISYRQVLGNAALEMERLIRLGVKFDMAVDEPRFKPDGYEEIIRCKENGTIVVSRQGEPDVTLSRARKIQRPDLGPMPSMKVQIVQKPVSAPGPVILKAEALPGTGEIEDSPFYPGRRFIVWEVITPENVSSYNLSQDPAYEGEECRFEAKVHGVYRIRTATVDCFGRPCIVETTLEVKADANDISNFAKKWAFQKDPKNEGGKAKWFSSEFDDSAWPRIAVPANWEKAPEVGEYDGFGWYRTTFSVPPLAQGKKLTMKFDGVDEEAWIYLNGALIGEHSCASTGKPASKIWNQPFEVKFPGELLKKDGKNVLAVRVYDSAGAGGLYQPIHLILTP